MHGFLLACCDQSGGQCSGQGYVSRLVKGNAGRGNIASADHQLSPLRQREIKHRRPIAAGGRLRLLIPGYGVRLGHKIEWCLAPIQI